MSNSTNITSPGNLRCAIYTRKSSEEGLDQAFNSLDAQREACEAYIASQASLGWKVLPELYDDGGISGGSMERPALQRLLNDIQLKKIDVVVVYKIDRLTRSLMDFSRIVEIFDGHGVSFVSITQQFNTTTSMGRLTLNILLSFAQFEREVTAERIRDKVAASKKKGMWMGGNVPLGYQIKERRLVVDDQEAETVRWLFHRYLDLKSLTDLSLEAQAAGLYRSGTRKPATVPFGRGKLHHLLTNPVYIGKVRHKDAVYDGEHVAIIEPELYLGVHAVLSKQSPNRRSSKNSPERHLLGGLLHDEKGKPFVLAHAENHNRRYRYYVSRTTPPQATDNDVKVRPAASASWRLASTTIEPVVAQQLHALLGDKPQLAMWHEKHDVAVSLPVIVSEAEKLGRRYSATNDLSEKQSILRRVFHRILVKREAITYEVQPKELISLLLENGNHSWVEQPADDATGDIFSITVPIQIKSRGVESKIVLQNAPAEQASKDQTLIATIAKAHCYLEALTDGSGTGISDLAKQVGVTNSDVSRILPMAFPSPKITEAILTGRQPIELTIARLTRMLELPIGWKDQHALLNC